MNKELNAAIQALNEKFGTPNSYYELSGHTLLLTTRIPERYSDTFMQTHETVISAANEAEILNWINQKLNPTEAPVVPAKTSKK